MLSLTLLVLLIPEPITERLGVVMLGLILYWASEGAVGAKNVP